MKATEVEFLAFMPLTAIKCHICQALNTKGRSKKLGWKCDSSCIHGATFVQQT